jgi:hypothetical protein
MPVADLDISVRRTTGRAPRELSVEFVRDIGEADLALLASGRGVKPQAVKRLRDRHHALARCLAQGMSPAEASAVTGYDVSRISILRSDPSFQELMKHYATVRDSAFAEFQDRAATVANMALGIIAEKLEDEDVSLGQALQIAKDLGDRTGNAPVQKTVQTNVNISLGDRLAAARKRVQQLTVVSSSPVDETGPPEA